MVEFNEKQVVDLLRVHLEHYYGRSQKTLARDIGITPGFLNDVLKGRRAPTGKVLKYLEFTKVVVYRKKAGNE